MINYYKQIFLRFIFLPFERDFCDIADDKSPLLNNEENSKKILNKIEENGLNEDNLGDLKRLNSLIESNKLDNSKEVTSRLHALSNEVSMWSANEYIHQMLAKIEVNEQQKPIITKLLESLQTKYPYIFNMQDNDNTESLITSYNNDTEENNFKTLCNNENANPAWDYFDESFTYEDFLILKERFENNMGDMTVNEIALYTKWLILSKWKLTQSETLEYLDLFEQNQMKFIETWLWRMVDVTDQLSEEQKKQLNYFITLWTTDLNRQETTLYIELNSKNRTQEEEYSHKELELSKNINKVLDWYNQWRNELESLDWIKSMLNTYIILLRLYNENSLAESDEELFDSYYNLFDDYNEFYDAESN
jgi:hypothetical protein